MEQGWPDQAELLLNEAIRQRPKNPDARIQLAESMWKAERREEARAVMSLLFEEHSDDPVIATRLAEMEWSLGNTMEAVTASDAALRFAPNSTGALQVKARTDVRRGNYEAALCGYIRLAQLAPDRADIKMELAELHVRRGNADQAFPVLREVMQLPNIEQQLRVEAEWKLGLAYASTERWTDAATYLALAIEHRESTDRDWQCLSTAKSLAGQDADGAKTMARLASSRQISDDNDGIWTDLRDRVASRSLGESLSAGNPLANSRKSNSGVISADFSRTAMADIPSGN